MTAHQYTDNPICPHCSSVIFDAWDLEFGMSGTEEVDCEHCGEPYIVTEHVSVSYSTEATNEMTAFIDPIQLASAETPTHPKEVEG